MNGSRKGISLTSRGLKPKLYVAISLMSVIPLLICLNFIFPNSWLATVNFRLNIGLVVLSALVLASAGYKTIKEMIDPVIKISHDARRMANGELEFEIDLKRDDEIGALSHSLNEISHRIRQDMDELRNYGERTKEINQEINKRVMVLSSMLQISNLISQNSVLNQILEISVEKVMQIEESTLGLLLMKEANSDNFILKSVHGPRSVDLNNQGLQYIRIKPNEDILGRLVVNNQTVILDSSQPASQPVEELQKLFSLTSMLIASVHTRSRPIGILLIGNNRKDFVYPAADVELIEIFAKQIAIAVENEELTKSVNKLQIKDALTGLFNEDFIRNRLEEEIKRAIRFQRPCAFILFEVDNAKEYLGEFGVIASESVLKRIAISLLDSISDIDKAARFGDNQFALILPERNKRQCMEKAEEIRKNIEFVFSEEKDSRQRITVSAAAAENPIDGVTAQDIIGKAEELIKKSREQKKTNVIIM